MTQQGFKKFIGTKQFYKTALMVALPLLCQQLITNSVNLLDNLMIGQLGDASLGGVAAVNRYYMISIFATNGVLAAAAIYIAQFYGAKDNEHMKQSFRFSLLAAFLFALTFFALGKLLPSLILNFFTDEAIVISEGIRYLDIAAWTFLPMALSLSIASAMRSIGESKIPLCCSVVAILINGVFNYIMIFGHLGFPAMGVQGAALATLLARVIEAVLLLFFLLKKQFPFVTRLTELFKMQKELVRTIVIKASPLALNEVLWSCGMATLFKFYATRGAEVLSGYSISSTIGDLFFVLFGGMAVASTVLISQPLGANQLEEAKENAYRLLGFSVMLAFCFGVLMFASSFVIPGLYNVSAEANRIAVQMLRVQSFFFWIYMLNTECYFIMRAGGDTKSTLLMDSVFMWLINLPLVGAVCYLTKLPIFELYLLGQATDIVKLFFAYSLVKKEKWVVNLTTSVDDTELSLEA